MVPPFCLFNSVKNNSTRPQGTQLFEIETLDILLEIGNYLPCVARAVQGILEII